MSRPIFKWVSGELKGYIPVKRSRCGGAILNNQMFVIGGTNSFNSLDDIFSIDLSNSSNLICTQISLSPKKLPKLDSNSILAFEEKSRIYLFGGYINYKKSNQIIEINIKDFSYKTLKVKGPKPSPRCLNSIFKFKDSLYIFGGIDEASCKALDVWRFDLDNNCWNEIQTDKMENYPLARCGHQSVIVNNTMFTFGGDLEHEKETNDMISLDLINNKWKVESVADSSYLEYGKEEEISKPANKYVYKKNLESSIFKMLQDEAVKVATPRSKHIQRGSFSNSLFFSEEKIQSTSQIDLHTSRNYHKKSKKKIKGIEPKLQLFNTPLFEDKKQKHKVASPTSLKMQTQFIFNQKIKNVSLLMSKSLSKFFVQNENEENNTLKQTPEARDGYAIWEFNNRLYIFGGDRQKMAFNNIFAFDLPEGLES